MSLKPFLALFACILLAACAQPGANYSSGGSPQYAPTHYYAPPGPPDDPWGPYIDQAAARFSVPGQWVRAVMAQESGGEEQAVSPVGAMGLMQLMPATWEDLRNENGLGDDPFNPQDNILAGTAYIKEMYDRYGAPGFLAAYNAGPDRLDGYLAGTENLPDETVNYLAAIAPNLGDAVAMSGPLANYATAGGASASPSVAGFATGCDVNAAYDPDHPCTPQQTNEVVASVQVAGAPAAGVCDADRAYDPANPCSAGNGGAGQCDTDVAYDPDNPCTPAPAIPAVSAIPAVAEAPAAPAPGGWGIQVGAFTSPDLARAVAQNAQSQLPEELGGAAIELPETTASGGQVLYRARLGGLSPAAALQACGTLNQRQLPCIVLPALGS